ncbi:PQQ-binding-like beta-propeller repeat protein [Opitutia bacterium ISCC 51]|nr:PQQ-binding-like beta-propeller repeat protein [Opitutae bacterium ISCC 51]QXD29666.1 PQQ-binding-like beta-propeller repeat protein [Opitutae bacterium ISCC 52]
MRGIVFTSLILASQLASADWTQWRGSADGQGVITGKAPVTEWSETKNVIWKSKIHGSGSSSPVIVDGKIYLTAADPQTDKFFLHCYDQKTGKQLWERIAFWGEPLENLHKNNTHASGSAATNGEVITTLFGLKDALWLAGFTLDGKKLWDAEVVKVQSQFGTGTSPVVYKDKVIVMNDMEPNQMIVAYDINSGKKLWQTRRNEANKSGLHSYSTPRLFSVQGKDRLVTTGLEKVVVYDPETGKKDWEMDAGSNVTVGTPLINRRYLYVNGGWPQSGSTAIDLRKKEVIWKNRVNTYISSMVFYKDHIYGTTNRGEFSCVDAKNGIVVWRERFKEDVQASPFVAGGHIYLTLRGGVTKVIKADGDKYVEVSENEIRGTTDATPVVIDGLIYYRGDDTLYCIGKS